MVDRKRVEKYLARARHTVEFDGLWLLKASAVTENDDTFVICRSPGGNCFQYKVDDWHFVVQDQRWHEFALGMASVMLRFSHLGRSWDEAPRAFTSLLAAYAAEVCVNPDEQNVPLALGLILDAEVDTFELRWLLQQIHAYDEVKSVEYAIFRMFLPIMVHQHELGHILMSTERGERERLMGRLEGIIDMARQIIVASEDVLHPRVPTGNVLMTSLLSATSRRGSALTEVLADIFMVESVLKQVCTPDRMAMCRPLLTLLQLFIDVVIQLARFRNIGSDVQQAKSADRAFEGSVSEEHMARMAAVHLTSMRYARELADESVTGGLIYVPEEFRPSRAVLDNYFSDMDRSNERRDAMHRQVIVSLRRWLERGGEQLVLEGNSAMQKRGWTQEQAIDFVLETTGYH